MKISRFLFLLLLLQSLFCLSALAQTPGDDDAQYIKQHYDKREVLIPMRDGVRLFTAIYTPKDGSAKNTYPLLLRRTPYSCSPYGADAYTATFLNPFLMRSGYIFVYQDVRGKYMSEGQFVDVRPFNPPASAGKSASATTSDEATDTYDTIDWLVKNLPQCNGNAGVLGISYPGFYATMAILARHPAIKAVSPQAPVSDWFIGDDFHHNGAFMLMDAFSFYSGFGKPRSGPTTEGAQGFQDWNTPDNYDFYLKAGALRNYNERFLHGGIPFWNDLMAHPDYDAWWKARTPLPHLKEIMPAVLTVGGLFDAEDCWGAWNTYKAIESQNAATVSNRIVMGPWVHGGWMRTTGERLGDVTFDSKTSAFYQEKIEAPFFDFYLKKDGKGKLDLPEAWIFETGSNQWRSYESWPPKAVGATKYLFGSGGSLSLNPSGAPQDRSKDAAMSSFDEYVSDPAHPVPYTENVHLRRTREYMTDDQRFASRRPDVLTYQTAPLTQDMTVAGPVTAELWVSTTGTDADFVVKLIDVFPDTLSGKGPETGVPLGGYQMLVRGEIIRGRYRDSYEFPQAFEPGQVTPVKVTLPDVSHTFRPGHRLMIQVQSSWFPLADRNPQQFVNIYEAKDEEFVRADHRLWHTEAYPSGVVLPVLKK